ncbi:DNA gyrase subunit A [compost metagenome]
MIITTSGTLIRTSMDGISTMGRYAQGVKLINIREDDAVATLCRADKSEEDEFSEQEAGEEVSGGATEEAGNEIQSETVSDGEEDNLE